MIDFKLNNHFYDYIKDWESEIYLLVGGYGSSKSYHTALKVIVKLLEEKRKALIVREVFETHRESTFDLFIEIIEAMGLNDRHYIYRVSPLSISFYNGSRIIFKGMDKSSKLKSLNDVSLVWVEECTELKYSGFMEILGRLRHPTLKNHILLTSNPVSKNNWLYKHFFISRDKESDKLLIFLDDEELYKKRIIEKNNIYYHHSVVDDNFFVPKSYIDRLDSLKMHDSDLYRIARWGRFGVTGKLVLPQLTTDTHDGVLESIKNIDDKDLRLFNGMDFGFETSYNALVRVAVDTKEHILYIYDEYYTRGKTDPEIVNDLEKYKDILIKADSAEPKTIRYFRQCGFRMRGAKKFQGSREQYTKKVKRFKSIVVSSKCINTIRELRDLTFKVNKDGEIIEDEFNIDPHTLSAIWYALDRYEVSSLKGDGIRVLK